MIRKLLLRGSAFPVAICVALLTTVQAEENRRPSGLANAAGEPMVVSDRTRLASSTKLFSPNWRRDTFEGTIKRTFAADGRSLVVDFDQRVGGFDTAIVRNYKATPIDQVAKGTKFGGRFIVDVDVKDGFWWVGPKLGIYRTGTSGLPGNYENYIVESASLPIEEFHATRMKRINKIGGAYLGALTHDGSPYHYYLIKHKEWDQFWAVRENYRESGTVSLKTVFDKWRKHGMKNYDLSSLRLNIEASGKQAGEITIDQPVMPDQLTTR